VRPRQLQRRLERVAVEASCLQAVVEALASFLQAVVEGCWAVRHRVGRYLPCFELGAV
jgi:hypothetical protein